MPDTRSPCFLRVDDHALYLTGLRLMLAEGWPQADVWVASTWAEAVATLQEGPVDLLLLDIHLPDAHGVAKLPFLRDGWPDTPVVVMSADVNAVLVGRAREGGACGYLHKSALQSEVLETVRGCLAGKSAWGRLPYDLLATRDDQVDHFEPAVNESPWRPTPLQIRILSGLSRKAPLRTLARALDLNEDDVRAEVSWVTESLGASSREEAVALAIARGMIERP
jgi:two-component system nitrate/nitrite response regulator NarL